MQASGTRAGARPTMRGFGRLAANSYVNHCMSIKLDRHAVISAPVDTLLRGLAADDAGKKGKR